MRSRLVSWALVVLVSQENQLVDLLLELRRVVTLNSWCLRLLERSGLVSFFALISSDCFLGFHLRFLL